MFRLQPTESGVLFPISRVTWQTFPSAALVARLVCAHAFLCGRLSGTLPKCEQTLLCSLTLNSPSPRNDDKNACSHLLWACAGSFYTAHPNGRKAGQLPCSLGETKTHIQTWDSGLNDSKVGAHFSTSRRLSEWKLCVWDVQLLPQQCEQMEPVRREWLCARKRVIPTEGVRGGFFCFLDEAAEA